MKSILINKILDTEKFSLDEILNSSGKIYTFLNPVSYLDALRHKSLFDKFDGIFADGSLLVAAIKMMYGKKVTRRSLDMTSIGRQLLEISNKTGKSLYFVASKQEEVEKAISMLKEVYPNANIIGFRNGYFANDVEMDKEAKHIFDIAPDCLIVGMGAIKQEEFMLRVRETGYKGVGFTCGGFIHQTAHNKTDFYPEWIDRINLRFFYRMWKEPHTRKRYLIAGLLFPPRFIWERLFG